jgi:hypothetical protein
MNLLRHFFGGSQHGGLVVDFLGVGRHFGGTTMPIEGGRPIRGYRPSVFGLPEDECEEAEIIRLANLELYARRASAGLPIFDDIDGTSPSVKAKRGVTAG